MGLLTPWALGGLLAIGLPVYLHLLRQYKNTPVQFSSLMFFERRVQSSIKHRRLKYKVLLALRAAFLAFLIFAFARPFIESHTTALASGGRTVALLFDDSFSMRQGSRLNAAKDAAHAIINSMHAEDRAQLIVLGGQTRLATELTGDRATLNAAVQAIEPGDGASSFAEAARAVRSLAQSTSGAIEAHLFSDMQKSSMPASFSDLTLPAGSRLIPHPAVGDSIPNIAVESVIAPHRVSGAAGARIQATLVSYSDQRVNKRVSLWMNQKELATKGVDLAPGARASVEFNGVSAPYGLNRAQIRIDSSDAFPNDDHYNFSIERSDPAHAAFLHEPLDTRSLFYLQTALAAAPQPAFDLTASSYAQAATQAFDKQAFVVLSDPGTLPRGLEASLQKYVARGGSLLILLGRNANARVPVADLPVEHLRTAEAGGFASVTSLDATHPVLRVTPRWDGIRFFQHVPVTAGTAQVLATLNTGDPLILERRIGEGRVVVIASPLDRIANDLPLSPLFVPLIERLAAYLGHEDTTAAGATAGAYHDLRAPGSDSDTPVEVLGPNGERLLSLSEATRSRSLLLDREGFYDIRRPDGRRELVAVNPDRRESDFSIVPAETLALWKATGEAVDAGNATASPKRTELWWYVLMAAFLLAIAESIAGNRHLNAATETQGGKP